MTRSLSRRTLLRGAIGTAVLTGSGLAASACSGTKTAAGGGSAISSDLLPTFKDPGVIKPDMVSASDSGLCGYLRYPAAPPQLFRQPPLSGTKITSLTFTYDPVAPGFGDNPLWQNVNKLLGADLDIVYAPSADYPARFATAIAGGDLPDTVAINPPVQQLPAMLKAKFANLTEHLGGDAVLKYPYLAAIPAEAWRRCVINGALWAVPVPRPPISTVPFIRKDLIEAKGLAVQPKSFAEFSELLVGLTDEKRGRWASADMSGTFDLIAASLGIGGLWREEGGKFTFTAETEQYEQALADVKALVDRGVFHPDGISSTNNQRNDWFTNGVAPIVYAGYVGWSKYINWGKDIAGFDMGGMLPFDYDSSAKAQVAPGNPVATLTALKKADKARVEEVLTYLNWLAAPFGSQEHLARAFGVKGSTFNLQGTDPILTSRGQNLRLVPFGFIADAAYPLYDAGRPNVTRARFDYQEKVLSKLAPNPTVGLYSETASEKEATLTKTLQDARNEIFLGRKPVSSWKDFMASWRSGGGDTIRAEYEAAYAEAKQR